MKLQFLWLLLAAVCILYGGLICSTGSGTGFFLVWMALGGVFLLFALAAKVHFWGMLPVFVRTGFLILLTAGFLLFFFVEAQLIAGFRAVPENDLDYIIVLGAQVYETGPSMVLRYRLDRAADYLQENKKTRCIVSGGQGYNEPFSEAEGMRDYLVAKGIGEERILLEASSSNTRENITYSMELLDPARDHIGIVTNNFHICRAMKLAKKAGLAQVTAIPADSTALFLPNNLLREFLGIIKDTLVGNI